MVAAPPPPVALAGSPLWGAQASWQVRLRWLVPPAILFGVTLGRGLGIQLAAAPLLAVAVLVLAYNLVFWWLVRRQFPTADHGPVTVAPAVAQVTLDYLAMFLLVYLTGGAASPLVIFFLFHIVGAAILLTAPVTWLFTAVAVGGMAALAVAEAAGVLTPSRLTVNGVAVSWVDHPGVVAVGLVFFGLTAVFIALLSTALVARLRSEQARALAALAALADERAQGMIEVAHNLRSPLAAAVSMLDIVVGGYVGGVNSEQLAHLTRIRGRLTGLIDMVGELLELARGRNRTTAERVPVDLEALAAEVAAIWAEPAGQRGVKLAMAAAPGLPTVTGDVEALRRMLENLVANAVKYTPPGGQIEVSVSRPDEGSVRLEVLDTGIGIPAAEQHRLFDPFFRASNARTHDAVGTGLGLALVKQTAEGHGGTVRIESAMGQGTTVIVDLPAR